MSVINQMLKDLEQQKQAQIPNQASPVVFEQKGKANIALIAVVSAIVLVTGFVGYTLLSKDAEQSPLIAEKTESTTNSLPIAVPQQNVETLDTAQAGLETPVTASPADVVIVDEQQIKQTPVLSKPVAIVEVEPLPLPPTESFDQDAPRKAPKAAAPVITETAMNVNVPDDKTNNESTVSEKSVVESSKEPVVVISKVVKTKEQRIQSGIKQAEDALLVGDKETAKQHLEKVLSLDPTQAESREKLAALLYGEQRNKAAVKLLQEGLSVSPNYPNFRLMLARIYLKNKDKAQAYYYLKPYQPSVDDNIDYYALLAGLAQNLSDLEVALNAYSVLTKADPNRAKWWLGLGITADKLVQKPLALQSYKKAQAMGQLSSASRNYIDKRIALLEK